SPTLWRPEGSGLFTIESLGTRAGCWFHEESLSSIFPVWTLSSGDRKFTLLAEIRLFLVLMALPFVSSSRRMLSSHCYGQEGFLCRKDILFLLTKWPSQESTLERSLRRSLVASVSSPLMGTWEGMFSLVLKSWMTLSPLLI